jgi:predicted amidophosphoribosyltransferase
MPVRNFAITCTPRAPAVSLGDYHPYRVNGERNPAFDKHSGFCLSLKDPANRDFAKAVAYFSTRMLAYCKSLQGEFRAEFIPIPSHVAGKQGAGMKRVLDSVCRVDKRFSVRHGCLQRTQTIEKLAAGGPRATYVHLDSMVFDPGRGTPQSKIIIDDVTTTGNSLEAAVMLVRGENPGAVVSCLVFGKTTHE